MMVRIQMFANLGRQFVDLDIGAISRCGRGEPQRHTNPCARESTRDFGEPGILSPDSIHIGGVGLIEPHDQLIDSGRGRHRGGRSLRLSVFGCVQAW